MKTNGYTEPRVIAILRQAEGGVPMQRLLHDPRPPEPQIRRNLAQSQTIGVRDPNRIPLELRAVSCRHIQTS